MREIITLSNGKRVANFSSPHAFTFTDGSIIPAMDDVNSERLKVIFTETEYAFGDVSLEFSLSKDVKDEMAYWVDRWRDGDVDVVFCAQPMIVAIFNEYGAATICSGPFRGIRMEDRILKLASIDKQCITFTKHGCQ